MVSPDTLNEGIYLVKIKFRKVPKAKIEDLIETDIFELPNKKAFDAKLKELRQDNYVLEYDLKACKQCKFTDGPVGPEESQGGCHEKELH